MIPILHLDLSEAADNIATDGETLIVFWWKDVPLGQVYWLRPYDPEAAFAKAVDPAILARAPEWRWIAACPVRAARRGRLLSTRSAA